jgi:hypothetical protein
MKEAAKPNIMKKIEETKAEEIDDVDNWDVVDDSKRKVIRKN